MTALCARRCRWQEVARAYILEHDVSNLLDLSLAELAEDNDLVQPVQELRSEVLLELLVHQSLNVHTNKSTTDHRNRQQE